MGLKTTEILLIMGVVLLLFGGARLPQLGSSLGSAIRNFKRGFNGEETAPEDKPTAAMSEGRVDMKDTSARSTSRQG